MTRRSPRSRTLNSMKSETRSPAPSWSKRLSRPRTIELRSPSQRHPLEEKVAVVADAAGGVGVETGIVRGSSDRRSRAMACRVTPQRSASRKRLPKPEFRPTRRRPNRQFRERLAKAEEGGGADAGVVVAAAMAASSMNSSRRRPIHRFPLRRARHIRVSTRALEQRTKSTRLRAKMQIVQRRTPRRRPNGRSTRLRGPRSRPSKQRTVRIAHGVQTRAPSQLRRRPPQCLRATRRNRLEKGGGKERFVQTISGPISAV